MPVTVTSLGVIWLWLQWANSPRDNKTTWEHIQPSQLSRGSCSGERALTSSLRPGDFSESLLFLHPSCCCLKVQSLLGIRWWPGRKDPRPGSHHQSWSPESFAFPFYHHKNTKPAKVHGSELRFGNSASLSRWHVIFLSEEMWSVRISPRLRACALASLHW